MTSASSWPRHPAVSFFSVPRTRASASPRSGTALASTSTRMPCPWASTSCHWPRLICCRSGENGRGDPDCGEPVAASWGERLQQGKIGPYLPPRPDVEEVYKEVV